MWAASWYFKSCSQYVLTDILTHLLILPHHQEGALGGAPGNQRPPELGQFAAVFRGQSRPAAGGSASPGLLDGEVVQRLRTRAPDQAMGRSRLSARISWRR